MTDNADNSFSWLGWTAIIILGLVSLACLLAGGTTYAIAVGDWADHGYIFDNVSMAVDWVFGLVGAAVVAIGILIAGICLRIARLPFASLVLSILSVAFLIATFLIYSRTGNGEDSIEVVILQGLCILGLLVISLPPFLHWLLAKRKPAVADLSKAS